MPAGESDRARIQQEIRSLIASGQLVPGQQLPSAAELAKRHGVHQRTAANALYELRDAEVIYSRRGRGYYVAGAEPTREPRRATIDDLARDVEDLKRRLDALEQRQQ